MNRFDEDSDLIGSLYEISSLALEDVDPDRAAETILATMAKFFEAEAAYLTLANPDTGQMECESSYGLWTENGTPSPSLQNGLTAWVGLHGKPRAIADFAKTPRFLPSTEAIRSEMAVPLMEKDYVIGAINLGWREAKNFTGTDIEKLARLTTEAGRVLDRLWLVQRLENKARQLGSLLATGQNLVSRHGLGEVLETIPGEVLKIMNCKVCALFLLNPDGKGLTLQVAAGTPRLHDYTEKLNLEDSALGSAILYRKQVEVADLPKTEEHHFVPVVQSEGLISMLATPITYEGEAIGVLNVYTGASHRFDNGEKSLYAALAGLTAVAIQNARLYEKVVAGEEVLRRSERLGALGLLTSEIAHEIRNPLTVIKLLFESLELDFPIEDLRHKDAEIIKEKLNQLDEIVRRVLGYGKSEDTEHKPLDLDPLLRDTIALVRLKLAQKNIRLCYEPEPDADPTVVVGHKGQLQQIFLNLILNAYAAAPQDGLINISHYRKEREGEGEAAAVLEFADNGSGIPAEIREHIFDSCFSGRKEGTGLGLAIVKRIVQDHRGQIEIAQSTPNGTTIQIKLPLDPNDTL